MENLDCSLQDTFSKLKLNAQDKDILRVSVL